MTNRVLVGSRALEHWGMDRKAPSDWDYWSTVEGQGDVTIMPQRIIDMVHQEDGVATPDTIYTIKCSHLGWDNHWQKTKLDVLWLKSHGCVLIEDLYHELVEYWKGELGNKSHLSLARTRDEFFDDHVTYVYDHDYLHELVAYPDEPVYKQCLKDGQEVLLDKDRFEQLPFDMKVRMFKEEIAVIASERWLINPYWSGKVSWYKAHMYALQKTIVSLTKNWATEFLVLNLEHFIKPEWVYFEHLINSLQLEDVMSNVDMMEFEKAAEEYGYEDDLEFMVWRMCEGGVLPHVSESKIGGYPERNGRSWDDPSYQEERDEYTIKHKTMSEAMREKATFQYEHIEQEGGGEGGAEYCYGIFKLNDKYYRAEYRYYSYEGHDYEGILNTLQEVKPVTKTVTVYE